MRLFCDGGARRGWSGRGVSGLGGAGRSLHCTVPLLQANNKEVDATVAGKVRYVDSRLCLNPDAVVPVYVDCPLFKFGVCASLFAAFGRFFDPFGYSECKCVHGACVLN